MFGAELDQLARDHRGYRLRLRTTRSQGRLDLTAAGRGGAGLA